jgi:hypothetical protein
MGLTALRKADRQQRLQAFLAAALQRIPDLKDDIAALARAQHIALDGAPLHQAFTESVDM